MSEENPESSPSENPVPPVEPIVAEDIETPTETTATTPTAAAPARVEAAAAAPVAAAHPSSHVMMPKWVVFSVVGIALAAIGFGVGWVAKPDDSSSRPAASVQPFGNGNPFGSNGPFSGNNGSNGGGSNNSGGNNGGNGNSGGLQAKGAFLGVSATAASGDASGVEVAQVVGNSPADDAGLQSGDVITKVDDTEVTSPTQLVQVISSHDSGDKVTVTYTRNGQTKTADVTLGDRADAPSQAPSSPQGTEN
jgi:membrane-associated protease RseP (regulator of RpoE activity)